MKLDGTLTGRESDDTPLLVEVIVEITIKGTLGMIGVR